MDLELWSGDDNIKNTPISVASKEAITERCYHEIGHFVTNVYFKSKSLVRTSPTKMLITTNGIGTDIDFEIDAEKGKEFYPYANTSDDHFYAAAIQMIAGYYTYKTFINDHNEWVGRVSGNSVVYTSFDHAIRSVLISDFRALRSLYTSRDIDIVMNEAEQQKLLQKATDFFNDPQVSEAIQFAVSKVINKIDEPIKDQELTELIEGINGIFDANT